MHFFRIVLSLSSPWHRKYELISSQMFACSPSNAVGMTFSYAPSWKSHGKSAAKDKEEESAPGCLRIHLRNSKGQSVALDACPLALGGWWDGGAGMGLVSCRPVEASTCVPQVLIWSKGPHLVLNTYHYLFVCLSICLSIYLSIYPSIHLSIHLSISLSISLSLSLYLSIYIFIYRSIYGSIYRAIYRSIYLSIYPSIYLSIYLSAYLSIYLPISPSLSIQSILAQLSLSWLIFSYLSDPPIYLIYLTYLIYLIYLIYRIYLIYLIYLIFPIYFF